jgi:predicted ribosomally synthesized peptide with SipW-like signal peptide
MTDGFELSRRKVLGALGGIGVASAGAGLGTSAFLNDTESFQGNSLTAGELDLKIDWEEHYYNGMDDGKSSESDEATVVPGDPNPADVDYYLPAMNNPDADPIALNFETSQDALWDATAIEAFPDSDGNGRRDASVTCADLLSVDDALSSELRTAGNGQTDAEPDPLVKLGDVKPGDFGEITFSFHLCDNPGYVWMQGEFVEADENGITEPEGEDKDEDGDDVTVTSTSDADYGKVELLDEIRTRMWYDENCDNQIETADEIDVMIAVDDSISAEDADQVALEAGLNEFVSGLPSNSQVGALTFGNGDVRNFEGLGSFTGTVPTGGGSGNTPLPPALDIAAQELETGTGDEQVIVVFTDGGPNYENETYNAGTYSAPRSDDYTLDPGTSGYTEGGGGGDAQGRPGGISDGELKETAAVARKIRDDGIRIITVNIDVAGSPTDPVLDLPGYLRSEIASSQAYAKNVALDDLAAVANDLAAVTMDEDLFFEGSLREALEVLSSGRGIPLDGDTSTPLNEFMGSVPNVDPETTVDGKLKGDDVEEFPDGAATNVNRDCFPGGDTTHCVGFEWWLPIDHANQIQGDSVEFNLGFYTEQCRHNDGSGSGASP